MPRRPSKDPADPDVARGRALRALARREHSARQLKTKLAARGVPEALAGEVVEDFTRRGWQSDVRFAESVIRTRVAHGYGALRIEAELSAAGIDDATVRRALAVADVDWSALARAAYQRRFEGPPDGPAAWQKAYRFLAQRGFTADQTRAVLRDPPGDDVDA